MNEKTNTISSPAFKGKLILIPSFLGEDNPSIIPDQVKHTVSGLNQFIVENARTARRYLRAIGYTKNFDTEVTIHELDKHGTNSASYLLTSALKGESMGLISEAGNPCVADPGFEIVRYAHSQNIQVIPLVGPSSILLALIASGLNGQQFSFNGYLPIQSVDRNKKIRQLEELARRTTATQIFMETPFRNDSMLRDVISVLDDNTRLCIASDITLPSEYIVTRKIAEWKKEISSFHKKFCIFLIG